MLFHEVLDFHQINRHSKGMKLTLSASSFAKHIRKDPKTVINWINKGLIPNVRRIGNHFEIPIEEVEKAKTLPEYPPRNYLQN
jgi:hypothetical protein